jgi:hypothetical protein
MSRLDEIRARDAGYVHSAIDELEQAAEDRRWLLEQVERLREAATLVCTKNLGIGDYGPYYLTGNSIAMNVPKSRQAPVRKLFAALAALEADDDT